MGTKQKASEDKCVLRAIITTDSMHLESKVVQHQTNDGKKMSLHFAPRGDKCVLCANSTSIDAQSDLEAGKHNSFSTVSDCTPIFSGMGWCGHWKGCFCVLLCCLIVTGLCCCGCCGLVPFLHVVLPCAFWCPCCPTAVPFAFVFFQGHAE